MCRPGLHRAGEPRGQPPARDSSSRHQSLIAHSQTSQESFRRTAERLTIGTRLKAVKRPVFALVSYPRRVIFGATSQAATPEIIGVASERMLLSFLRDGAPLRFSFLVFPSGSSVNDYRSIQTRNGSVVSRARHRPIATCPCTRFDKRQDGGANAGLTNAALDCIRIQNREGPFLSGGG